MLHRILGGIFLLSIDPINDRISFKEDYGITHIISVLLGPLPEYLSKDYQHLQVDVTDEVTSNLLEHLPTTKDFIDEALFSGYSPEGPEVKKHQAAVLVHCAQGESRSVAVIVSYLMYKYKLSYPQALHAVKRKVAGAQPNVSFVEQIKLFQTMNYTVDEGCREYRDFLVGMSLKVDPSGDGIRKLNWTKSHSAQTPENFTSTRNFRCKKCRHVLATENQVEYHVPPDSNSRESQFVKRAFNSRRVISAMSASSNCSHYFLEEPTEWMQPELSKQELEGKFFCPKCEAKIGAYSWKGSRCSCGKWMIPALHLQAAKIDVMKSNEQS